MTTGWINRDHELVVPLTVLDSNDASLVLECVVDTGFSGDLTLPPAIIQRLRLGQAEAITVITANEAATRLNAYRGVILWQRQRRAVRIIEAEGTPLIGIGLLWGNLLTAAITDNGDVTIGPLAP